MPPGAAFLNVFADTLIQELGVRENPAALTDAMIFVPNRRSASALAIALYEALRSETALLPDIRPLGEIESGEAPIGTAEALAGLGPPLSEATRIGALASLVVKFYDSRGGLPPASALAAASELARILDQAALSGTVDWDSLPDLVEDADIAHHWQDSVAFLEIVRRHWPDWLTDQGAMDPFARRLAAAKALADHWRGNPPDGPVIIAGSTGATLDTRVLMQAVTRLEKGCIILPGLDQGIAVTEILATPSHSQHALARTVKSLNLLPKEIPAWPGSDETGTASARRRLIQEALAPAAATADWLERLKTLAENDSKEDFTKKALTGLTLIEAEDEAEEALYAALMMRETLETEGRTAALVTPDAGLSRRVSALLKRWGVDVTPSSGTPFLQTHPGSLIALTLDWALDPGDPVLMCAIMKHPLATFDLTRVSVLERCVLRGPRRWTNLADLEDHITRRVKDDAGAKYAVISGEQGIVATGLVAKLREIFAPVSDVFSVTGEVDGPAIAGALARLAEGLSDKASLWSGRAGEAAADMLEAFAETTDQLGPLPKHTLPGLLVTICADRTVRPEGPEHPRLAIWGDLEARLQSADRFILAGLNESVWPQRPAADAFLPRRFRIPLGLDDPEARLGLSAHDFTQLACAPDIVLLQARRRDDAPAVSSRWIWRLRTLAEGALGKDDAEKQLTPSTSLDPRIWADGLTQLETCLPGMAEPKPAPPANARPNRLSVTRINTLQRDPYAIYAESILGLSELDPLNAELNPRRRGTAIHAALEYFEEEGSEKSAARLLTLLETELIKAGETADRLAATRAISRKISDWYLETWRAPRRDKFQGKPFLEVSGTYEIKISGEDFTLSAMADRIEKLKSGGLAIIDFKTGAPPSKKQIAAGLEQQMPLQALIAREAGFKGIKASETAELVYVAFKAKYGATHIEVKDTELMEIVEAAEAGLTKLITTYADPTQTYLSAPRPQFIRYASAYARLARRAEWAGDTSDE